MSITTEKSLTEPRILRALAPPRADHYNAAAMTQDLSAGVGERIRRCIVGSLPKAIRTSAWLLAIMLPISLAVKLLEYFGVVAAIARFVAPVFGVFGLSGAAPLVFITAASLNIYSAIAVIETLSLSVREVTILAFMCLVAHNLFVETAVQRKTGSKPLAILATRLICAFAGAFVLGLILPGADAVASPATAAADSLATAAGATAAGAGKAAAVPASFFADAPRLFSTWAVSSLKTAGMIIGLVSALLVLQSLLTEFAVHRLLTAVFGPLLKLFGLPESTHFLWVVANTLGLAYGSAVLIDEVESGRLSRSDADLLNRHIAVSHSLLEDTLLFVAIGVGAFWITIPRIVFAVAAVWLVRAMRRYAISRTARSSRSSVSSMSGS
jgi:hypothetical protein